MSERGRRIRYVLIMMAAVLATTLVAACSTITTPTAVSGEYTYSGPVVPLQLLQGDLAAYSLDRDLSLSVPTELGDAHVGLDAWLADKTVEVKDSYLIRDERSAGEAQDLQLVLATNSRLINLIEQLPGLTVDNEPQTVWRVGSLTGAADISGQDDTTAVMTLSDSAETDQPDWFLDILARDVASGLDLRDNALAGLGSLATVMSFASNNSSRSLTFTVAPEDVVVVWGTNTFWRDSSGLVTVNSGTGPSLEIVVLVIGNDAPAAVSLERPATNAEAAKTLPNQLTVQSGPVADWVIPFDAHTSARRDSLQLRSDWQQRNYETADSLDRELTNAFLDLLVGLGNQGTRISAGEALFSDTLQAQRWIYLPVTLEFTPGSTHEVKAVYYHERPGLVRYDRQQQGLQTISGEDYERLDFIRMDQLWPGLVTESVSLYVPAAWRAEATLSLDSLERHDYLID